MTDNDKKHRSLNGHRIVTLMILCLFGLCVVQSMTPARKRKAGPKDDRVYLVHSDVLRYDMYGANPRAQIAKGHVHFRHQGAQLWCDSAYFYEESNSFDAFGHVRFKQGASWAVRSSSAVPSADPAAVSAPPPAPASSSRSSAGSRRMPGTGSCIPPPSGTRSRCRRA